MEGSKVEIFPSSLTLPGGSEQSQFVLVNIPHETGVVTVVGKSREGGRDRGGIIVRSGEDVRGRDVSGEDEWGGM
jgi:hypothetical protein